MPQSRDRPPWPQQPRNSFRRPHISLLQAWDLAGFVRTLGTLNPLVDICRLQPHAQAASLSMPISCAFLAEQPRAVNNEDDGHDPSKDPEHPGSPHGNRVLQLF